MAEWLYEAGIGEARAALIDKGEIVEALLERDDGAPRIGAVLEARLVHSLPETNRALLTLEGGAPALLRPAPARVAQGQRLRVLLTREPIPEEGNLKPAFVRLAEADEPLRPGPALRERIDATPYLVRTLHAHEPDALEAAGWSEVLEEARTGLIAFPGGLLRLSLTPAMALFDIDGQRAPGPLAIAGARAAAAAIRRHDITGSIGLDLPTTPARADRQAAAAEVDALLPQPFERTTVNGFGFLQIVRPRTRLSLPERLRADPIATAALALLRRAERSLGAGPRVLAAAPPVIARLAAESGWLAALARKLGTSVALQEAAGEAISAGYVHIEKP